MAAGVVGYLLTPHSDPTGAAGVHATVLSILAAALAIYAAAYFERIGRLQEAAFEAHRRATALKCSATIIRPTGPEFDARTADARRKLLRVLAEFARTDPESVSGKNLRDLRERAESTLASLALGWPFELVVGQSSATTDAPPTLAEVRKWASEATELRDGVTAVQQLAASRERSVLRSRSSDDGVALLTAHIAAVGVQADLAAQALRTAEEYSARQPAPRVLLYFGYGAMVAFIAGVLAPLASESTPVIVAVVIPGAYYIVAFGTIMRQLHRWSKITVRGPR